MVLARVWVCLWPFACWISPWSRADRSAGRLQLLPARFCQTPARFCARCGAFGCAFATFPAAWPRRSEPLAGCSAPTALAQPPRRAHRAPTPHTRGCAHCATLPAVTALLLGLPSCGDEAVSGALLRECCVQRRWRRAACGSARLFPPLFLALQRLWTQGVEKR